MNSCTESSCQLKWREELFIEKSLGAAHRNLRLEEDGATGAPVTELEYKHVNAVLEEAIMAT